MTLGFEVANACLTLCKCTTVQSGSIRSSLASTVQHRPLESSLQLVALDGVALLQAGVGWVEALVRQAAEGRVVLRQTQQRAPHKHAVGGVSLKFTKDPITGEP